MDSKETRAGHVPGVGEAAATRAEVRVREYTEDDLAGMVRVWNEVVEGGRAFPQVDPLTLDEARRFFAAQSTCGVAVDADGTVIGMYILHPNNLGRCGHVANASYAVASEARGRGVGRALVTDSLARLEPCGFRGLQFNAVVEGNAGARHLYESLGFTHVGMIPGGFCLPDGTYENTHIYYHGLPGEQAPACPLP